MNFINILLLFIPLASVEGTNSSQFPNWQSSWIVGGTKSQRKAYMVSLRNTVSRKHFCAGSIISNRHVLTAAHCIHGKPPTSMRVVAATKIVHGIGKNFDVLSCVTHHDFNPTTLKYDIGIVKLSTLITFGVSMTSLPLPHQEEITYPGTSCIFMGWGKDLPTDVFYNHHLQIVGFKVIPVLKCLQSYLHVSVTYICADAGPGKGASEGDEGGPLVCDGKLSGVYAGQRPPGPGFSPPYATLFIRISQFTNWILNQIA